MRDSRLDRERTCGSAVQESRGGGEWEWEWEWGTWEVIMHHHGSFAERQGARLPESQAVRFWGTQCGGDTGITAILCRGVHLMDVGR